MEIVCKSDTKRKEIIKAIKHIMLDDDISISDVASKIGQTYGSTGNLLNPSFRPDGNMTIDTLAQICDALGYDLTIKIDRKSE